MITKHYYRYSDEKREKLKFPVVWVTELDERCEDYELPGPKALVPVAIFRYSDSPEKIDSKVSSALSKGGSNEYLKGSDSYKNTRRLVFDFNQRETESVGLILEGSDNRSGKLLVTLCFGPPVEAWEKNGPDETVDYSTLKDLGETCRIRVNDKAQISLEKLEVAAVTQPTKNKFYCQARCTDSRNTTEPVGTEGNTILDAYEKLVAICKAVEKDIRGFYPFLEGANKRPALASEVCGPNK